MMPCQLPYDSLRIFSQGSWTAAMAAKVRAVLWTPRPWREVLAVILQLFYLKNPTPTDPQFVSNLPVVLFTDKLVAGVIHGN
jgi:hypothetical protein